MGRGRKENEISGKDREEVKKLAMLGVSNKDIAYIKSIPLTSLKRRCQNELKVGRAFGKSTIQETAFKMAASGRWPAMTIFWLKTKCGWREKNRLEVTGKNGKPLPANNPPPQMPSDPIEAAKIYQKFMAETQLCAEQ